MANTLPTTMEYFDNLLGEQLTEGGGSGGGGSSDFSTATVTVNATIDKTGSILPPICALNMPIITTAPSGQATGYADVTDGTTQYTVILYKGKAVTFSQNYGEKTQLYVTSSTGNVEYDEGNEAYIITGDCTLNVTNVQP